MDFIPTFHFISSLVIFGLLMYMYNPTIEYLSGVMGIHAGTNTYAAAMFFFWSIIALVNIFGSGIRLIMKMQQRPRL